VDMIGNENVRKREMRERHERRERRERREGARPVRRAVAQ